MRCEGERCSYRAGEFWASPISLDPQEQILNVWILTVTAAATVAVLIQSESILVATMTAMMIRNTMAQKSWVTFVSPYDTIYSHSSEMPGA